MRIGFLADPLDTQYGGIHTYTKNILSAISQIDKKNEYLVIRAKPMKEFEGFEEIVVPYHSNPFHRLNRVFFKLPKLLRKKAVELVVEPAHFGPFNLPSKIKRITVIHDMTMFLFPQHHEFVSQFVQRKFLPRILRKSDHIITNSVNTANDLSQFFPFTANKTTAILLGKNNLFFPQKDHTILVKYHINAPYFLYIGTLEPRKNLVTLIHAFNHFKSSTGKPHHLVLAGKKGWKSNHLWTAIAQSPYKNDIVMTGYVDQKDLPILCSMAEIFVYPSLYEGFGLPILEAMACGVPVITARVSSLPEVGGEAVHYFSPDKVDQLSQKMIQLSADATLRKNSIEKGLAQASRFSWEKAARETIAVFERTMNF